MKLEKHPLITEYLAGIPRLIKLSATILADKSLTELYEFHKKKTNDHSSIFQNSQNFISNHDISNDTTVTIAMAILDKLGKPYFKIISLISMFPGGVSKLDLEEVLENFNGGFREKEFIH